MVITSLVWLSRWEAHLRLGTSALEQASAAQAREREEWEKKIEQHKKRADSLRKELVVAQAMVKELQDEVKQGWDWGVSDDAMSAISTQVKPRAKK